MPMCPFCGLVTAAAHESQEGCIEALHAEIARVRAVLQRVHSVHVPRPADDDEDADAGSDTGQTPA